MEKILRSLAVEARARGGAVLAVRGGGLSLFVVQDLGIDQLAAVKASWETDRPKLAGGAILDDGVQLLAPILDGTDLVGVLYLDSPRAFDTDDTATYRALLGKALRPHVVPAIVGNYPATQPAQEMEKERLLQTRQRNEWNIARVARQLGLGRPTIYARLQRYGIDRKKVPKTLKRMPVQS